MVRYPPVRVGRRFCVGVRKGRHHTKVTYSTLPWVPRWGELCRVGSVLCVGINTTISWKTTGLSSSFPILIGYLPYLTITLPTQAKFPSLTWVPTLISPPHATLTAKHTQTCLTLPHPTAKDWLNIRPKRLTKLGWNDPWGPKRPVTKTRPDM